MLELHCRWDEHCMCRGENLFPWKLAKGTRETYVCSTHSLHADRSQYEDGGHFPRSVCFLPILSFLLVTVSFHLSILHIQALLFKVSLSHFFVPGQSRRETSNRNGTKGGNNCSSRGRKRVVQDICAELSSYPYTRG